MIKNPNNQKILRTCSKQAANSEYKTRLKQAIESLECVPSSKTLLKLEKKLDLGRYKNNWTRYDDWKENRKANVRGSFISYSLTCFPDNKLCELIFQF